MGISCIAIKPKLSDADERKYAYRNASWRSWAYLLKALAYLKVPLDGFHTGAAPPRHGERNHVGARTARKAGAALKMAAASGCLFEVDYPHHPPLEEMKSPVYISDALWPVRIILPSILQAVTDAEGKTGNNAAVLHPLDEETKQWLLEWSEFFLNCGGFEQR